MPTSSLAKAWPIQDIGVADVQPWMQHLVTRTSNPGDVVDGTKVHRLTGGRRAGRRLLTDFRKVVNRVSVPAGWKLGAITPLMFRHSYASSRLQTVDRGAPVASWTVEQGMGHGSADGFRSLWHNL